MRFTLASVLALAGSALAQTSGFNVFKTPASHEVVTAGTTYPVEWTYNPNQPEYAGPITIELYGGKDAGTLQFVSTLASKYSKFQVVITFWAP